MKLRLLAGVCAVACLSAVCFAPNAGAVVVGMRACDNGLTTAAVHQDNVYLGSGDYYGSGTDDSYSEYGVTTFNFTSADFGTAVDGIVGAELALTVNDRTFSDGDKVEILFTPDTASDLDSGGGDFSALASDPASPPSGINPGHFVTAPFSLGVFDIAEMAGRAGGEVDTFSLNFGGAAETALIDAINTGTDFQIIVAATVDTHDITYSGVGNTYDPGDPNLCIYATPEPGTIALVLLGSLVLFRRRRC